MSAVVLKIGGSTLGAHDTTLEDVVALQRAGRRVVVVHGGGPQATEWLKLHGVGTQFVRGLRVTDPAALEVVVAVLAGLVNKQITGALNARGGRAVGLSGADGPTVLAEVREPELGRVGAVREVRTGLLAELLGAGYVPVLSSIGLDVAAPSPDAALLNINADTVAGEVAAALGAARLVFLTDVPGVQDGAGVVRARLAPDEAEALVRAGVVSGGMIPKVEACLRAARAGTDSVIVDGREPHALLAALNAAAVGTRIG
ncbi:MAG: acetylglutamate kinase [Chloroflexota bacterium]